MKYIVLSLLMAALVLSACGTPAPDELIEIKYDYTVAQLALTQDDVPKGYLTILEESGYEDELDITEADLRRGWMGGYYCAFENDQVAIFCRVARYMEPDTSLFEKDLPDGFVEFDAGPVGDVARGFFAFDEELDITHDSVEFIRGQYAVGVVMEAPGKADLSERTRELAQKIDARILLVAHS